MLLLRYSNHFKKDLKLYKYDKTFLAELEKVLDSLIKGEKLSDKYRNHSLTGEFRVCFELHIKPDILLVYKIEKSELIILLLRIGSHSDLF